MTDVAVSDRDREFYPALCGIVATLAFDVATEHRRGETVALLVAQHLAPERAAAAALSAKLAEAEAKASRLRLAALWAFENPIGTPVPTWVDVAINDQSVSLDPAAALRKER